MKELKGLRAIVTGASKGIGRAISERLVAEGAPAEATVPQSRLFNTPGRDGHIKADAMIQVSDVAEAVVYVARQPDRIFLREMEIRVTRTG